MSFLTVNNLSKSYGNILAINNLSFSVDKGEIFGIIGPDGSGKTTLFRIMTTLIIADRGTVTIDDFDVVKQYKHIRNIIGYMPGRFSLYQDLTVEENLKFFATIFNTTIEKNYSLIEDIYKQIEPFKKRKTGKLSGGMKQKLALSCALIHKPDILFLDEPTTGVDPVSRKEFWEMLINLKKQGITIVVSTPYMDEATLCDRIALIKDGEFMQLDTPKNIIADYPDTLYSVKATQMHNLMKLLRESDAVKSSFSFGETFHVTLKDNVSPDELVKYLYDNGLNDIDVTVIDPTIEDCFMLRSKRTTK